ncbi:hypothetical protein BDU57DRAFT_552695 [Ampelomyces quisqualis]|uniref:AMP-dependent synthetase/ligase domain-containing protein n=1 Tax=Ampelomyces quisqualis TaxID=50730 RepID=A0A6A5R0A5_AMPQU|nr:hypothetical protein BDU57DRAFT_552695 [Ampelomyces quisqualis]
MTALSIEDRRLLSRFGRGPAIPVPHSLIHEAIEAIVEVHSGSIAAKYDGKTLTYQQLDTAANQLAHYLVQSGLRPRERVCLVVHRSFEMLVGLLAILKVGCQYAPIDGGVTSEQALEHIFSDSDARFILCLPKFWNKIRHFTQKNAIILALTMDTAASYPTSKPLVQVLPHYGAYAIYTSGSTGRPKGVDVSHSNVTNALLLEPARLGITVGSKVAQVLNVAFDMGAWEILGCLMNGGTLHMRGSEWKATLSEVDTLVSTPSILAKYEPSAFPNIKSIAVGGEHCSQTLADAWAAHACFYNICGPTEVTILNTAHRHTPRQPLSIGKPLPNTTCYILDDAEQPVAVGEEGTMWVGGAGVSRGYIHLPELNLARFKPDKFADDGSRMFNTGDLARWTEDGSVQMLGRKDDQVKIKGFRVELDGVTAATESYPSVTKASSMLIEDVLYGFYTSSILIDETALDAYVRKQLPYYSVPAEWRQVLSFPLTANGKVDKKKLRAVAVCRSRADSGVEHTSPATNEHSIKTIQTTCQATEQMPAESNDMEKGLIPLESKSVQFTSGFEKNSTIKVPDTLPPKTGYHGLRWLRHRAFILYRRFFSVILLVNVVVAGLLLYRKIEKVMNVLTHLSTATAANLLPTSFPLLIRRHCARVFHIGGIHSGCALAAIVWYATSVIASSLELARRSYAQHVSLALTILSYFVLAIFLAMGVTSHPKFRAKYHNVWELTHRFGGWTSLVLLWTQTLIATKDASQEVAVAQAYLRSPSIWLLAVATAALIFPWLYLRKVAVRSEVLSQHAVRLWFEYTTPVVGTAVRLAERPLVDWHGFATIPNRNGKGFSLIVSRAGDFTGRTIERAPTHIYVRGIPTCGVLRIATLFRSVVLVATGSGIGPCLAVILAQKVPCRIVWTAPNPEKTFGQDIVDSIKRTDPHAVIWNTRTQGKPNVSLLAHTLWKESGAEAVCVISNKKLTTKIVYDMEARGIPAYGAIFDS